MAQRCSLLAPKPIGVSALGSAREAAEKLSMLRGPLQDSPRIGPSRIRSHRPTLTAKRSASCSCYSGQEGGAQGVGTVDEPGSSRYPRRMTAEWQAGIALSNAIRAQD